LLAAAKKRIKAHKEDFHRKDEWCDRRPDSN
jgi:hypothetical protein